MFVNVVKNFEYCVAQERFLHHRSVKRDLTGKRLFYQVPLQKIKSKKRKKQKRKKEKKLKSNQTFKKLQLVVLVAQEVYYKPRLDALIPAGLPSPRTIIFNENWLNTPLMFTQRSPLPHKPVKFIYSFLSGADKSLQVTKYRFFFYEM